jgi:hypothetical protein
MVILCRWWWGAPDGANDGANDGLHEANLKKISVVPAKAGTQCRLSIADKLDSRRE